MEPPFQRECHLLPLKKAHFQAWLLLEVNSLRTSWERVGCYVRQTLSFSKSDESHDMITKWFIIQYNLGLSLTT